MPGWDQLLNEKYEDVYASTYDDLMKRLSRDPDFTLDDVRGFLVDAYVYYGNDWIGRGCLFDTRQSATIAAYEAVLAELADERASVS